MKKTFKFTALFLLISSCIFSSNVNAQSVNGSQACGTVYAVLGIDEIKIVANQDQIKKAVSAYWLKSAKVKVNCTDITVKFEAGNPNIYLIVRGMTQTTSPGVLSMALVLKKKGRNLILDCESGFNACAGDNCPKCDFNYDDSGRIKGCKVPDVINGTCNHAVSTGIDPVLLKNLPAGMPITKE